MDWLSATVAIYRSAFTRAAEVTLKNWPVLGSVFVYLAILIVGAPFAAALGVLGGMLMSLASAACVASFLYLVEMMVRTSRVSMRDFQTSFGVYLWPVIGVSFAFWLFRQLALPVLAQAAGGGAIVLAAYLVILVLFNAVPELIYIGHHSTLELLSESYEFVTENWIEWFPANLLLGLPVVLVIGLPGSGFAGIVKIASLALFVYYAMVVRGFLFLDLSGTSRRSRIFRHKARS